MTVPDKTAPDKFAPIIENRTAKGGIVLVCDHGANAFPAPLGDPGPSAADGVTHTLRLHATPYGLPSAMLEIRNDLIANPQAERMMAEMLAPVLNMGLVEIQKQAKAG